MILREQLYSYFKSQKDIYIGMKELTRIFNKDARSIKKQLDIMEENGEIKVKRASLNGSHSTNRFVFKGGMKNGKI